MRLTPTAILLAALATTACNRPDSAAPRQARSGAELWSANCKRCHLMRQLDEYGHEDWKTIMIHMRVRVNMTGDEYRQILAFLGSGQ